MFCPFCGNNNPDAIKFCGKCGGNLQTFNKSAPTPTPKPTTPPTPKPTTPPPTRVTPPPIRPAKPAAPPKPPKEKKPIDKQKVQQVCLQLLLVLLYSAIAVALLLFLHGENSIQVKPEMSQDLSINQFLNIAIKGNRLFHPTVLSISLGIATLILLYAVPVFALVAMVGCFLKQKAVKLHTVYMVASCTAAAVMTLVPPLALRLVPDFKQALALQAGALADDLTGVIVSPLWLLLLLLAVPVVASSIVLSVINKKKVK